MTASLAQLSIPACVLACLLAMAPSATAQTPGRIPATVTQIAGDDAFLNVGRDDGLADGDTLRVWRADAFLGRMLVVGVASGSAVVTYADAGFPLTRGDRLEVETLRTDAPPPVAPPPVVAAEPGRESILETPPPGAAARAAPGMRLTGTVQVGADAVTSETTFQDVSTSRQFSTPFASVRARLDAGAWRAELDARAQTRFVDDARIDGGTDVRIYQAAVRRTVGRAEIRAGRFIPERERFSGAWDGLDLRLGDRRRGVGVVGGLRPDRVASAPDPGVPGGFAYAYADRPGAVRLSASGSAGAVLTDGLQPFLGAAARIRSAVGGVPASLSVDALGDLRPDDGAGLARFSARATVQPLTPLTLRAYARRYRASALDGLDDLPDGFAAFASRSVGLGATATHRAAYLSADVSRRASGDGPASGALSLSVAAPLPRTPLRLDASATVWRRDDRSVRYFSAGLSGTVRGVRLTGGWRRSESPAGDLVLVSQGLSASAYIPLTQRFALRVRGDLDGGGGLRRTRLYSALWVRL